MSSTDSADEPTEFTLSPPRKRIKQCQLDVNSKEIILNVYKCEMQENPTLFLDKILSSCYRG